ncbi:uncharacterized protein J3R85_021052 [Psidium guajava]|nr:uncharacterized protein J3R85_021052 [Psidium guajava]
MWRGSVPLQTTISFRWKLRWHPQAAHLKKSGAPSSPSGMNSPHPSTTWPRCLSRGS